jgi:peptidoglycan hydrolase CwlO-like protein
LNRQRGYYIIVCISENQVARKTDKRKKEKDKIIMWKCIRCEKENQDTEEICTGCGHGRTMDYISHRTLAKISISLSENWKRVNREEAEEFVQKKLTDLSASVQEAKKKISDAQNEINTLNGEVQERNKIIEKNEKIDRVRKTYGNGLSVVTAIVGILFWVYLIYQSALGNKESTGIEYIKQNVISFVVCAILFAVVAYFMSAVLLGIVGGIGVNIIGLLMGKSVNEETLKKVATELDSARQSIDKKRNEITTVQSELNSSEQQLKKIKKDKESIINKLSQLSPQEMEKEFARLV